jgi:hypothetical protein
LVLGALPRTNEMGVEMRWMVLAFLVGCNGGSSDITTDTDLEEADADTDSDADADSDADTDTDTCADVWHRDLDQDGYGTPIDPVTACEPPEGYIADGTDCNDTELTINPGAVEVCDELDLDEDCDELADDDDDSTDTESMGRWYTDADGDGYGDRNDTTASLRCEQPDGMAASADDCDDNDPDQNPGEVEVPGDEIDNDCDGGGS